jgi:phage baseplate assembly protein W
MANPREYIKINPIDIQTDVAIGVPFPFNAEGVFSSTYTTSEQVKSNLLNVLLTEPGERVFKPNFGVGLRKQLFENRIDKEEIKDRISAQINRYIRGVELLGVEINKSRESHELYIKIIYKNLSNNKQDAIQVNFNNDKSTNNSTANSPALGF